MTLLPDHYVRSNENNIPYQGYLSQYPYQALSVDVLQYYYYSHPCPSCHCIPENLQKDPSENMISIRQFHLCVISSPCACGFDVPFIGLIIDNGGTVNNGINHHSEDSSFERINKNDPDIIAESQLFHCSILIHQKKYHEVLLYLNQYAELLSRQVLSYFYRAYCFEYTQEPEKALEAYDQCLDLDRYYFVAWHNKARLLKELGRLEEAQFHLTKYQQSIVESTGLNELYSGQGMFGNIRVMQTSSTRYLMIGQQVQGNFWLDKEEPSNIPASQYTVGLLLAASVGKWRSGLILGLGAGAGIIALLVNNPQLRLTVLEIDSVLIAVALQYFPLLNVYTEQGRLTIVTVDAYQYLETTSEYYDVTFLDIYQGSNTVPSSVFEKAFIHNIQRISKNIVMNLLCENEINQLNMYLEKYQQFGIIFLQAIPIISRVAEKTEKINWVLLNQKLNKNLHFLPYANDSHYLAKAYQRDSLQIQQGIIDLPNKQVDANYGN